LPVQHSNRRCGDPQGDLFSGGTPVGLPGVFVKFLEHRVFVVDLQGDGLWIGACAAQGRDDRGLGLRRRLWFHFRFEVVYLVLVGFLLVVWFVFGVFRDVRGGHAGEPPVADVFFDPHLAAQVNEIADKDEIDDAVNPPDGGPQECGEHGGSDGYKQHAQDDALPARVFGAGRERGRFGVESAAARTVFPAHAGVVAVGGGASPVGRVVIVQVRVDVGIVAFGGGPVGGVLGVGRGDTGVGCPAAASAHDSRRERGVVDAGDRLPTPGEHWYQDGQPCDRQSREQDGAGHASPPPPGVGSLIR
jgi:hypothetical protein